MVAVLLFSNNATSRLPQPIGALDTSILVSAGEGAKFPQPVGDGSDFFTVTFEDRRSGQIEICNCTARSGDALTIERGREGTTAQAFLIGATVSNRLTAGTLTTLLSSVAVVEAPVDGLQYGRQDASWTLVPTTLSWTSITGKPATFPPTLPIAQSGVTNLVGDLALKAPLDTPAFTGDPTAPTPPSDDRSASIATTEFVNNVVDSNVIDWGEIAGVPVTFPPELPIPQTGVINLVADLAGKAPLASPVLSGVPTAPTAAPGTSTQQIASTAFVGGAVDTAVGGINPFPEAPSDGLTYGRKDAAWATVVGGAVISITPPPGPLQAGQLWYKSDTGNTYIWYVDADSSQWVQINVQPAAPQVPAVVGTAQAKNRLVNGAMTISQENPGTAGTTSGYYPVDQWYTSKVHSAGTMTAQRVISVTPNGSTYRFRLTITAADTALAAGEHLTIRQSIEGLRVADFDYGLPSARQSVLRFGFKGPAGTYGVGLQNGTLLDRSYLALFTITAGQANTDTVQTFVIPGDTTGTWLTDSSIGIRLVISVACGTTYQGVVGWQAGDIRGASAMSNGMATAGAVFELFDAGLYLDPLNTGVAPPWVMPIYSEELTTCQRYYCKDEALGLSGIKYGAAGMTFADAGMVVFPVTMRIDPAVAGLGTVTPTNCGSAAWSVARLHALLRVTVTASGGYRQTYSGGFDADARM